VAIGSSGARLVEEQHLRSDRERPGDAEPLLLSAGKARARRVQDVLDLLPQPRMLQRVVDAVVQGLPLVDPEEA